MTKDEELEQLRQENSALRDQVVLLSQRIQELEGRLAKDSHNSHLPLSSDRFHRQTKSLRTKSEKQAGGQLGHPGTTLHLSPTPDLVMVHPLRRKQTALDACQFDKATDPPCGPLLTALEQTLVGHPVSPAF